MVKNHRCLNYRRGSIRDSDKHTLCIDCLGDDHFVDIKDRMCEQCMGLGESNYRWRRHDWVQRQLAKFNTMLEKEDGGGGGVLLGRIAGHVPVSGVPLSVERPICCVKWSIIPLHGAISNSVQGSECG